MPNISPNNIPGEFTSLIPTVITAAPSLISQAQSTASEALAAAKTNVANIVPKNCSLGTKHFCVGFSNHVNCINLPLNVSALPDAVKHALQMPALDQVIKGITSRNYIQSFLIAGLAFTPILGFLLVILILKPMLIFWGLVILHVLCGLTIFVSFLAASIISRVLLSKAQHLPLGIGVEKGEVSGHCSWTLGCAVIMIFITVAYRFAGKWL